MVFIFTKYCSMRNFPRSESLKKRLDELLVERGFFHSQSRAKAEILEGNVIVNGQLADKAGKKVNDDVEIQLKKKSPYVSRGAHKLLKAIEEFKIDLKGKVCADFGASTGGFTQVMLENGAQKVYSVDVGYGQFSWKLRNDPRVVVMERTNARFLKKEDFSDEIDFISCDLSFISLRLILPVVKEVLVSKGESVCLVKPQFEAGRENLKKGVVRSKEVHTNVLNGVISFSRGIGFSVKGLTFSPIKGPAGNVEFLLHLKNTQGEDEEAKPEEVVKRAWEALLEG